MTRHSGQFRPTHLALGFLAAALALLLLAPSALGFETRTPLGSFGPDGTSGTSFTGASKLAFNQANDKLYVLEEHFQSEPAVHAFNAPAHTPAGGCFPLAIPAGSSLNIAVDNTLGSSAGNVYYIDYISHPGAPSELKVFGKNTSCEELPGFPIPFEAGANQLTGIAVDSAGTIWISNSSNLKAIFKYDSAGKLLGKFAIGQGFPEALAFDSNNDLYVAMVDSSVWKYTAPTYNTATKIVSKGVALISQLAIDGTTHTLYAAENENGSVAAYDLAGTPPLTPLYRFGVEVGSGVAVDESTDQVYSSSGTKVRVYGALADFPDASATPLSATAVGLTTAELHATIDDNSALPTRWFFQLSKDDGATWDKVCPAGTGGLTPGDQSGFAVSCTAAFGLQADTEYLFRAVTNKGPGSSDVNSSELSFHTEALPNAVATPEAPTGLTATSAELHATIDDKSAAPTKWRFQLSGDAGAHWADTGIAGTTAGGQSAAAVSGIKTGLEPNTPYRFRVLTSKGAGFPDAPSGEVSFTTLSQAPVLCCVGAVAIADTSATLAGEVNARNDATSYLFKYGTSPGVLDSETPLTAIGAGSSSLVVAQPLAGLAPGTTYYFKLIASNEDGEEAESAELSFQTRAEPLPLPEDRAYEQVTPVDKNFADARNVREVAGDGGALTFTVNVGLADPPGQIDHIITSYLSRRSTGGWHTRWLGEPSCILPGDSDTAQGIGLSPNLDHVVIRHYEGGPCSTPPLDPAAPDPDPERSTSNLYLGDYTTEPATYQLLNPQPGSGEFQAGSKDFGHVIYKSFGQQTPDAPAGNFIKVFDWHEGALDLVSKDTAGVPFATNSAVPDSAINGVSASGDRVFLLNPAGDGEGASCGAGCELYLREDDTTTYDVSESECTSSCGASGTDRFKWATPSGEKALLTSDAKLSDDLTPAGTNLYLYTHSPDPAADPHNLTLLSKDEEAADGNEADVTNVLGMSDDGEVVYFLAKGQLVAGAPSGGDRKLYRWQGSSGSPALSYLGTLGKEDISEGQVVEQEQPGHRHRVIPDGEYLLIETAARLDPAADHDADRDVYRWGQEDGWTCASCQAPGVPSAGSSPRANAAMSEDGQRVFFASRDALLPADTNGAGQDVYEWHDGALSLISTGTWTGDATLAGAGRSGKDVFFTTDQRLVGWDTDDNVDVYDARIGGGFPEPPPSGAICEAEGCRGAGTSAPTSPGPGTPNFIGPPNPPPPPSCGKGKARKNGRCVVKKHSRGHKRQQQRAKHKRRAGR